MRWGLGTCLGGCWLLLHALGCPEKQNDVVLPGPPPQTSAGGQAGAGGGGGEGGFDDGCEEQPCKLVPQQCGCPVGQRCAHFSQGQKGCIAAGGTPAGAACDDDCLAGHVCVDTGNGAPKMCHRYCLGDGDCVGEGSRCLLDLADFDEGLCTHACEPVGQTGCAAANTKCDAGYSDGGYSFCTGVGAGVQGDTCAVTSDCGAGLTCTSVNAGPLSCYTWCDVDNPVCPNQQQTCTDFPDAVVIDGIEYGICV